VISHYVAMPFTRGFFCSDMTIKYPYKGNTIPAYAAVILSIGLPIIWVIRRKQKKNRRNIFVQMWTTEFIKRYYFIRYPKQIFLTKLELCGRKIARITPFKRNLYILTGTNYWRLFFFFFIILVWFSRFCLWLSCNLGSHRSNKEFRWRTTTTFSCCLSTEC